MHTCIYTYIRIMMIIRIRIITTLITPSPPIKSCDFRGFDSSKLSILKCGNSHVRRI